MIYYPFRSFFDRTINFVALTNKMQKLMEKARMRSNVATATYYFPIKYLLIISNFMEPGIIVLCTRILQVIVFIG